MNNSFTLKLPEKIIFGKNTFKSLPEILEKNKFKKCILLCAEYFKETEHFNLLKNISAEIKFIEIPSHEPVLGELDILINSTKDFNPDVIIGIGGGSVLDSAKYFSIIFAKPGIECSSLFGVDKISFTCIPTILLPTTTGTGSEVTNICILKDNSDGMKKGIVSDKLISKISLIDPELCISMPKKVLSSSSFDAICHAVEAYLSSKSNNLTDFFALEALKLLIPSLYSYFKDNSNAHINNLSQGSLLAGIAFANAGVNIIHAMAYPLSSKLNVPHGLSNAIICPFVMDFLNNNLQNEKKTKLNNALAIFKPYFKDNLSIKENLLEYLKHIGITENLSDYDLTDTQLDEFSSAVIANTRLMSNSPCEISKNQAFSIYKSALVAKKNL